MHHVSNIAGTRGQILCFGNLSCNVPTTKLNVLGTFKEHCNITQMFFQPNKNVVISAVFVFWQHLSCQVPTMVPQPIEMC